MHPSPLTDSLVASDIAGQIRQGDCIDLMQQLRAGSIDLVFADPPFNIGYSYDVYDDRQDSEKYLDWSSQWISQVHRILKPHGAFWLAIGDEYAAELKVASTNLGFHCRSWVIWYYTFGVHCKNKFTRSHAHLFHFVKDPQAFTFNAEGIRVPSARQLVYNDRRANATGRLPDDTWILRPQDLVNGFTADEDVWYFPRVAGTFKERAGFHGCQMPEQLLGRIIRACSDEHEVVLDPFSGSATTAAVAKKLGRRWVGFELSPEYAKLGNERLASIKVGDTLDGSPEPMVSAPATGARPKRRTLKRTKAEEPSVDLFSSALLWDDKDESAMVAAFAAVSGGFSVDRMMADPVMVDQFQQACDEAGIRGTPAARNRQLFELRRAGRLAADGIEVCQRTVFSWREQSAYLFASEIAWRRLSDEHPNTTLDDLLCDPRLASQFDQLAERFSPGYRPLEYRWAAIRLRKRIDAMRCLVMASSDGTPALDPFMEASIMPIERGLPFLAEIPETGGVYVIMSQDEQAIYLGDCFDLRDRTLRHFGNDDVLKQWTTCFGNVIMKYVVSDTAGSERQDFRGPLMARFRPAWNVFFEGDV